MTWFFRYIKMYEAFLHISRIGRQAGGKGQVALELMEVRLESMT